jgi:hypothetical protein
MAIPTTAEPTAPPDIAAQIELARKAAVEVFGNCISVELMRDPECPGESWYDFSVEDDCEVKASIERELRWHERVRELIPEMRPERVPDFRLSLIYKP